MVGRRSNQMLREDMERRFYRLGQFLGGYLHEDWPELYGTPEIALGKAMEESPIELRQQARRELTRVLAEFEEDKKLREVLNSGLGVNVFFKKPKEARIFAESVETKLLGSIEEHFDQLHGAKT